MPRFIRIGDEIINLDNVLRIERGTAQGTKPTVLVYFIGDQRSHITYTDEKAAAVWQRFSEMADEWIVPEHEHSAPAGPGRTAKQP